MLVLSRKSTEKITIGDDITITIVSVRGEVVRVGIDAPRELSVRRAETLEKVAAANTGAASAGTLDPATLALLRRAANQDADTA